MVTKVLRAPISTLLLALIAACGGGDGAGPSAAGAPAGVVVLSGAASAAAGLIADSDVNDPQAPYASNDAPAGAQAVPAQATVSGYSSAVGSGPGGSRFALVGDEFDSYRGRFSTGQVITLSVSLWDELAPADNDLDLLLFDLGLNPVASSLGIGPEEALTIPADGEYYVVVAAAAGASTYQLVIGAPTVAAATLRDRLSITDDFVADEVVVAFKPEAAKAGAAFALSSVADYGLVAAGEPGRPVLLRNQAASGFRAARAEPGREPWSGRAMTAEAAARWATIRAVKALRANPDIASASPNYLYQASAVPNDPLYRFQWHYPLIRLPQAWDVTVGTRAGAPVIVAVIDTGVVLTHPDLQNQLVAGFDFIRDPAVALDNSGIDADPTDPGDRNIGGASSWHGTHVAGTVAAQTDNAVGVAGVAAGARIMPIRVLGRGGGNSYDINQGIRYAAGLSNDSGGVPPQLADVINLSLGGPGFDQTLQDSITAARAAGVIVVAAAGNEATQELRYPAAMAGVISVSAVGVDRNLAPYSNFGSTIDVAAPGGDVRLDLDGNGRPDGVLSTFITEPGGARQFDYALLQGTSMAAPHVAGVAALMRALAPALTPEQFDSLLASGALTTDIGAAGRDVQFGNGLIDALKAVTAAQDLVSAPPPPPVLVATPARLDFGTAATQLNLRLDNGGSGSLSVTSVTDDAGWLSSAPLAVTGAGLGDWRLSANRVGLAPGAYAATVTVATSVGTTRIPVSLQVTSGAPVAGNAGRLYFLLIDPLNFNVVDQRSANAAAGTYPFSFTGVPVGRYRLVAGSDLDNDGFICGPGETCGGWPILGQAQEIDATGNRSGLNFAVSANGSIASSATEAGVAAPSRGYARPTTDSRKTVAP